MRVLRRVIFCVANAAGFLNCLLHTTQPHLNEMKMTLAQFHRETIASVRSTAELTGDQLRSCYVDEVGRRLSEAEEINDFHLCHFDGLGEHRRRILVDGYSFDEADGSLALLVANFTNEDRLLAFGAAEARKAFSALKGFLEEVMAGNLTDGSVDETHPAFGLASDILQLQESVIRFRLYFASDGQLNTRVEDWPEEEIGGIPVEFNIWDIVRFYRAHESTSGRDELEVDFCATGTAGLPCLKAGSAEGEYQAYLCMISGDLLASVYERHGSRLLEGNVRSFLSKKGKVNTGIQKTIEDAPEMFFAYNNGITATAEELVMGGEGIPFIRSATNFQIVNGGQTTASLAEAHRSGADLSSVFVQMKLSVLPPERSGELIPLIARFANSQNKVNDADFFANHPYHVRIEEISRRLWTPAGEGLQSGTHWFYERARGQFTNEQGNLSGSQKKQFLAQNPKSQLLTKTDLAKLENTWRGMPHKVSLGAQKNFTVFAEWVAKQWREDQVQFNEEYFRYLAVLAILFRHTETLVKNQPWYQGGYRANIVTYSLAKLQHMIAKNGKGSHLDMREIWSAQAVPAQVSAQLALVAKGVFEVLTNPGRPKDNVTEWAKSESCWKHVQEASIPLDHDLLVGLVDPLASRSGGSHQMVSEHLGLGLYVKNAVIRFDGNQWDEMRRWATHHKLVTPRESDLLRAASRLPRFLPTAKQCEEIWKIRQKLVEKGYV